MKILKKILVKARMKKTNSRGIEDHVESNDTNHNEIANINLEENKGFFI